MTLPKDFSLIRPVFFSDLTRSYKRETTVLSKDDFLVIKVLIFCFLFRRSPQHISYENLNREVSLVWTSS